MDWNAAIEHHREALKRVLAMLTAMAGLANGLAAGSAESGPSQAADGLSPTANRPTLPRHLHRAVLRLLRPAEAAARRLVAVAARGLVVTPQASAREGATPPPALRATSQVKRGRSRPPAGRYIGSCPATPHVPALPLFDPLPRWRARRKVTASSVPRISVPGLAAPFAIPAPPSPFDPLDATRLALRFAALARTLEDLPLAARRFALWRARLAARSQPRSGADAAGRPANTPIRARRIWPFRPGRPPGQRAARASARSHPVHAVLDEVHGLALWALEPTDTS
ncbi:hypothetical protein FY036_02945 [Mesorhizobium microcysteis]|uniref:Uncharacterized protein n=1 Tax=Neoaquamicrobium microcysteis TaxID=2682781 RepID=A0A5D4H346_9HYPH|nr:hypothetical protein [Mesorhizobium microcysteis]TYR35246.1 hypothetical protein FY036_02945 [Mesorhizobium microcysteis]